MLCFDVDIFYLLSLSFYKKKVLLSVRQCDKNLCHPLTELFIIWSHLAKKCLRNAYIQIILRMRNVSHSENTPIQI